MNFLVTLNQLEDSFKAVMLSLKNQIDMHYDEVRKIARQAKVVYDNFDEIVTDAAKTAASEAAQMAVTEIKSEVDNIYGCANVYATAVLTE